MCPMCFATAALIAGSGISTGGLTAFVITKFCAKNSAPEFPLQTGAKEGQNDQHHDRS
jgi:hypothetical protein